MLFLSLTDVFIFDKYKINPTHTPVGPRVFAGAPLGPRRRGPEGLRAGAAADARRRGGGGDEDRLPGEEQAASGETLGLQGGGASEPGARWSNGAEADMWTGSPSFCIHLCENRR